MLPALSPYDLPALVAALTGAAYAVELILRRRRRRVLRRLAAEWRMNYGRADTLRLTPRVARHFPVPGAARLRVTHVIYGIEQDRYRYVFTADYTVGVVTTKRRVTRVAAFSEPRDRTGAPGPIVLAPPDLPLIDQYRHLAPAGAAATAPVPAATPADPRVAEVTPHESPGAL